MRARIIKFPEVVKKPRPKIKKVASAEQAKNPYTDKGPPAKKAGMNTLFEAEEQLRHRITHNGPFRYLDGKPCTAQRLMVEYAKVQRARKEKPYCRTTESIL